MDSILMERRFTSKKKFYVLDKNEKEIYELYEMNVDEIDVLAMLAIAITSKTRMSYTPISCYAKLISYFSTEENELKNVFQHLDSNKDGQMFLLQTIEIFLLEQAMRKNVICKDLLPEFTNAIEKYIYLLNYNNTSFIEKQLIR